LINFPNSILEDGKEILFGFSIDLSKNSPTILKALNISFSFFVFKSLLTKKFGIVFFVDSTMNFSSPSIMVFVS